MYQKRVLEAQRPYSSRITLGHGGRSPTTTGDRGTEEGPGESRRRGGGISGRSKTDKKERRWWIGRQVRSG